MDPIEQNLKVLVKLCEKVKRIENFDRHALSENKVSLLTEALEQRDLDRTRAVINNFQKSLTSLETSLTSLAGELDGEGTENAKTESQPFFNYISDMKEVLNELLSGLADKEFESGMVMSYWGTKVSLPQMIAVATSAGQRMSSFFKAYNKFKEKFTKSIISFPGVKDDKSIESQRADIPKIPKITKVENFAAECFEPATGEGFVKSIKSFFGSLLTVGDASKALNKFPNVSSKVLGISLTGLFMNSRVGAIKGLKMPPIPKIEDIKDAAQDAVQDGDTAQDDQGSSDNVDISKVVGSSSDVSHEGVTYRRATKSGNWYNRDEFENTKKVILVQDQDLIGNLNKALKEKVKSTTGSTSKKAGTPTSGSSISDEDKDKIKSILGSLSPETQKSLKGIIGDSFIPKNKKKISEALLTGKVQPKKQNNKEVDRWLTLAGIK
jgi:hypothetical protein